MKFAYADPPYLGCGHLYDAHHVASREWDRLETHRDLISRLVDEYPDGWALSLSAPSLRHLIAMCPEDVRVAQWVKPFAAFKPNVNPAYAYEPVIFRGGRKRGRDLPTVRDWIAESITLRKGLTGAKPERVCFWIFNFLGCEPDDTFDDLFPGTGVVGRCWERFTQGEGKSEIGGQRAKIPSLKAMLA